MLKQNVRPIRGWGGGLKGEGGYREIPNLKKKNPKKQKNKGRVCWNTR